MTEVKCSCEFCKMLETKLLDRPLNSPTTSTSCNRSSSRPEVYYDFIRLLGKGASGEVFEAKRKSDGEKRAVKLIPRLTTSVRPADVFLDAGKQSRIVENEISCWTKLRHPHVVMLEEVFRGPTHFGIVQELVTGGELFDRIVTRSHYSEADASALLAQILEAVQHIHSAGVLHRDLKPENLLLTDPSDSATIKVADFGLAAMENDIKRLHKPVGTPGYLAPEVVRCMISSENGYGKEADIWSIGVILYILLSGSPPFDLEDENKCFECTLNASYNFPPVVWGEVSESAKDLVKRILVADPSQRLTIEQIWKHPFMHGQANQRHLPGTLESLAKFNARKAWRVGIKAVMAATRFTGNSSGGSVFSRLANAMKESTQEKKDSKIVPPP